MSNKYSTTEIFKTSAGTIYSFYIDVTNWKTWDSEVEYSSLEGNFKDGATGILKPKSNPELKFQLQNVKENIGFDQIMDLPFGSKFILTRVIKTQGDSCEVTHSGYFEGVFGAIIGFFLKLKYTPLLQQSVLQLKSLAEKL